ncbi:hypothetical protein Tco_0997347 [Tanacetum coccineum]
MKTWVEIICENVFCLGGNWDYAPACLCHMLYCIATSTKYNLAFFIIKQMKTVRRQPKVILTYEMLLTRFFNHIMSHYPELSNDRYILYDRVMNPLAPHYERKTRADHGKKRCRHSTSSSTSALVNPSSSHPIDDENVVNDEGISRASTPSLSCFVKSLSNDIPQTFSNPPNIDSNMEPLYSQQTKILNHQN